MSTRKRRGVAQGASSSVSSASSVSSSSSSRAAAAHATDSNDAPSKTPLRRALGVLQRTLGLRPSGEYYNPHHSQ